MIYHSGSDYLAYPAVLRLNAAHALPVLELCVAVRPGV
jgi:hypothetical protein